METCLRDKTSLLGKIFVTIGTSGNQDRDEAQADRVQVVGRGQAIDRSQATDGAQADGAQTNKT